MILNLHIPIKEIDDTIIEDVFVDNTLAAYLIKLTQGDSVKLLKWSKLLFKGEPIEVTKEEFDMLKGIILSLQIPVISKGQILEAFGEFKGDKHFLSE